MIRLTSGRCCRDRGLRRSSANASGATRIAAPFPAAISPFRPTSAQFTIDDRYFPCLHVNWVRAVRQDHWMDRYDEDNRFPVRGST